MTTSNDGSRAPQAYAFEDAYFPPETPQAARRRAQQCADGECYKATADDGAYAARQGQLVVATRDGPMHDGGRGSAYQRAHMGGIPIAYATFHGLKYNKMGRMATQEHYRLLGAATRNTVMEGEARYSESNTRQPVTHSGATDIVAFVEKDIPAGTPFVWGVPSRDGKKNVYKMVTVRPYESHVDSMLAVVQQQLAGLLSTDAGDLKAEDDVRALVDAISRKGKEHADVQGDIQHALYKIMAAEVAAIAYKEGNSPTISAARIIGMVKKGVAIATQRRRCIAGIALTNAKASTRGYTKFRAVLVRGMGA